MLIEYGGIRPLYRAGHDYQLLLTFGLSLILTEGIIIVWSPVGMSQLPPPILRGGIDLGITFYPKYRLFVMVAAALLVLGAWLFLEKTRYGAIMRAGIEDKEMVALLGIDIHRLFTAAFAMGCVLAGVAGALTAPIRGLNPWMGVDMLGIAFVVRRAGGARQSPGLDRGGAARRPGPEPGGARLARGLGGGHLRGDGRGAARAAAGLVRHPMTAGAKAWLAILAAVVLLPLFVRHAIATEIWIFAIFGLGLNLLMGYTGLLSFGQATFFGSAALRGGLPAQVLRHQRLPGAGHRDRGGRRLAAAVGYLCVQRSGLYFIMLTFALNQMFYFTAYQWTTVTGARTACPGSRARAFSVSTSTPRSPTTRRSPCSFSCLSGS